MSSRPDTNIADNALADSLTQLIRVYVFSAMHISTAGTRTTYCTAKGEKFPLTATHVNVKIYRTFTDLYL